MLPAPPQANLVYTVNVAIAPPVTLPAATGGTGAISYTLTGPSDGPLPAGLMFNATTRVSCPAPRTHGRHHDPDLHGHRQRQPNGCQRGDPDL